MTGPWTNRVKTRCRECHVLSGSDHPARPCDDPEAGQIEIVFSELMESLATSHLRLADQRWIIEALFDFEPDRSVVMAMLDQPLVFWALLTSNRRLACSNNVTGWLKTRHPFPHCILAASGFMAAMWAARTGWQSAADG